MKNLPDSITKRVLWRYVNKKIKRTIHHYHVFSVITLLFEEMIKDLISGKEIKIHNFGILSLKQLPARKYHDVNERVVKQAIPHRILRFILSKKLRNKLRKHLDLDATFREE
jgi:nucleoid DNA-binding protein